MAAYDPTDWANGEAGGTPLSADNLNHLEAGVAAAARQDANLSDLASASAARTHLGLGTAAVVDVPASGDATSGQAVLGGDSRIGGSASKTGGGRESVASSTGATGTTTMDCSVASVFALSSLAGNITLAFSNVPATGIGCTITVIVSQNATVRTVTLPTGGVWLGLAPTQTASKKCVITLMTVDGGTSWLASGAVAA